MDTEVFEKIQNDSEINLYFKNKDLFTFIKKWLVIEKSTTTINTVTPPPEPSVIISTTEIADIIHCNLKIITEKIDNITIPEHDTGSQLINSQIQNLMYNIKEIKEILTPKASKVIGNIGEKRLELFLEETFPEANIINTSNTPFCADLSFSKTNHPDILIDSKIYNNRAVGSKEGVDKLCRDLEAQGIDCGLLACSGKIGGNNRPTIKIIDKKIIGILPNHDHSKEKFILMINFIYTLHSQIKDQTGDQCITEEIYNSIYTEFKNINEIYIEMLYDTDKNAKEFIKKFKKKLKFPNMKNFFKLP
jgi:hypothetical protein